MKKLISMLLCFVAIFSFTACGDTKVSFEDGEYRTEFEEFDALGWKDYVIVTVEDGELVEVIFDSVDEEGTLKSEDEGYKAQMEANDIGTYPAKYNQDLINQFLETHSVESVDTVAGATMATNSFKALMLETLSNAYMGEVEVSVIAVP